MIWSPTIVLLPKRVYAGKPTNLIIIFADTVVGVVAFFVFFLSDEFGIKKTISLK